MAPLGSLGGSDNFLLNVLKQNVVLRIQFKSFASETSQTTQSQALRLSIQGLMFTSELFTRECDVIRLGGTL